MTLAERFGRNLFMARRRAALSQEELAIMASVHRTEISLLERGIRLPRLDTFVKVAGSLEIGADELLDGISWRPGSIGLAASATLASHSRIKPQRVPAL